MRLSGFGRFDGGGWDDTQVTEANVRVPADQEGSPYKPLSHLVSSGCLDPFQSKYKVHLMMDSLEGPPQMHYQ